MGRLVEAASDWRGGLSSKDYPGYDKIIEGLSKETFESQVEKGAAWIGTPARLVDMIKAYDEAVGGIEVASLQLNFGTMPVADAERSMKLFASDVMPHFQAYRGAA